jgi:hypothetical protein
MDQIHERYMEIRPHLAKLKGTSEAWEETLEDMAWEKHVELLQKNRDLLKRVPTREDIKRDLAKGLGWIEAAAILTVLETIELGQTHYVGNLAFVKQPSGEVMSFEKNNS